MGGLSPTKDVDMKILTFRDKRYWTLLRKIAVPITLQNLIFNSFTLVDNILVGGLGEANIAAVGIANKFTFIFMLFLFGINSGANILSAQYWGKRDIHGVRKVLGLSLFLGLIVTIPFTLIGLIFPRFIIGFFSNDVEVIKQGAIYLGIIAVTYPLNAISSSFSMQSRGVGRANVPLYSSMAGFCANAFLDYALIYGKFGFPNLGVKGAAIATVVAKTVECGVLLYITYSRKYELAAKFKEFTGYTKEFLLRFMHPVLPVIVTEVFWALGVSGYTYFYGVLGTEAVATVQILDVVNGLFLAVFMGVGSGIGAIVGNLIGAKEEDLAQVYAKRSAALSVGFGIIMSFGLLLIAPSFLKLFAISEVTKAIAEKTIIVYACFMTVRIINQFMIVGVCRGGGDTLFTAMLDIGGPWLIGLPMAYLGVRVLGYPLPIVMTMIQIEEVVKASLSIWRLFSGKWIRNLVEDSPEGVVNIR